VAQLRYASRLPGDVAGQDYLGEKFTTFLARQRGNLTGIRSLSASRLSTQEFRNQEFREELLG
jgi:hypothetical protein